MHRSIPAAILLAASLPTLCPAQLTLLSGFNTGSSVGLAADHSTGHVWVYPSFGATIVHFSAAGVQLGTVPRPGIAANDADIEFTQGPLTLNGVALPDATLLLVNGEMAPAVLYAIDKATGAVLASLETDFGVGHVVGGAHHPQRGTIFLIQDAVPAGATEDNLVAEIDPATGAVLQSWHTTAGAPGFTINFGDIDAAANGHLLVVSSDESQIAEFTPAGALITLHTPPQGVSGFAGIGVNNAACEWWVVGTSGNVWQLGGPQGTPVCGACYANCDASTAAPTLNVADFTCFLQRFAAGDTYANCDQSSTAPALNVADFTCFLQAFAAGCP